MIQRLISNVIYTKGTKAIKIAKLKVKVKIKSEAKFSLIAISPAVHPVSTRLSRMWNTVSVEG